MPALIPAPPMSMPISGRFLCRFSSNWGSVRGRGGEGRGRTVSGLVWAVDVPNCLFQQRSSWMVPQGTPRLTWIVYLPQSRCVTSMPCLRSNAAGISRSTASLSLLSRLSGSSLVVTSRDSGIVGWPVSRALIVMGLSSLVVGRPVEMGGHVPSLGG